MAIKFILLSVLITFVIHTCESTGYFETYPYSQDYNDYQSSGTTDNYEPFDKIKNYIKSNYNKYRSRNQATRDVARSLIDQSKQGLYEQEQQNFDGYDSDSYKPYGYSNDHNQQRDGYARSKHNYITGRRARQPSDDDNHDNYQDNMHNTIHSRRF